ncbi:MULTISPECIES: phage tail tape measure protein [unclassified Pantoea]|uniref:phage tail tape measure protein n=1 Tax=unclassified Pantoea TaxID=2630326 RepID=UPI001681A6D2|nr:MULTISPECIES: phage tail tape measure protein [unclassified Pantoea]
MREGESATDAITTRTERYTSQLSRQEQQLKRVTAAQTNYDKARAMQKRLASAGLKASAAGGGLLWGTMRSLRPGMEFDKAYSQTLADAQLDRNSEQGQALRAQAKMLARTTHFSAVQAAQGQDQLISGGMTPQNAQKAMPGMINLALAAHTELGAAADVGSNMLDHFQLQASQMEHVSDVLVGTFTHSKTSLESLNETMEYVGTVANNAGIGLETTAAAAAMLAKNGLTGSIAGTGLKEALSGLYSPSKTGKEALESLRIKTVSATGAVRPLADVLKELWNRTRKFDQGSQFDIFKGLFGEQGMQAGQVLARAAAEGNLQTFNDYLLKLKGVAAQTSRTMTDNFDGDMQMLHSAWDGLWTEMEERADSPLRGIVQKLTQVIQSMTQWAQAHPQLTGAIIDTALAVSTLLLVGGTLITTLAGILGSMFALKLTVRLLAGSGGFGLLTSAVTTFGEVFSSVIRLASIEIVGLATLIDWPVALLVLAIGAIGAAFLYWWEPIRKWFSHLIEKLENTAKTGSWFKSQMAQFALDIINAFKPLADFFDLIDQKIDSIIQRSKGFLQRHGLMASDNPVFSPDKMDIPPNMSFPPIPGTDSSSSKTGESSFGSVKWTPPGKSKAGRSGTAANNSINRLGDIVFKKLPSWVPLSNGFVQPKLLAGTGVSGSALTASHAQTAPAIGTNVSGDVNLHIHIPGAEHMDRQQLVAEIGRQLTEALKKLNRQKLASLKDRE